MNSGKVRIYELSKDLNLENRDILAVCEKLEIQVKSHSSTISGVDADRIRDAAQSYVPVAPQSKPPQRAKVANTVAKKPVARPVPQKQQILEIRKVNVAETPKPQRPIPAASGHDDSNGQDTTAGASEPTVDTLPRVNKPRPKADHDDKPPVSEQPLQLSAPQPSDSVVDSPSLEPPTTAYEDNGTSYEDNGTSSTRTSDPVTAPTSAKETELKVSDRSGTSKRASPVPSPDEPVAPLVAKAPVVRPVKDRSSAGNDSSGSNDSIQVTKPSLVKRPVPRSAAKAQRADGDNAMAAPARPGPSKPGPVKKQDIATQSESPPSLLKPKPIVEANRPKRVLRDSQSEIVSIKSADSASSADDTVLPEIGDVSDLKLRRPSVSRTKRGKEREEEEEELAARQKPSKTGKGKRRSQDLLEDDFEEDLDGDDAAAVIAQVSLSLARPSKPKAKPSQPKPMTAPRMKKPPTMRDSSSSGDDDSSRSSRGRRDRREEPAKPERPEKITLTGGLTVQELARLLAVPETEVIRILFMQGIAANINQALELDTIKIVADTMEVVVETVQKESQARKLTEMLDVSDLEHLHRRPPVVTIMGHVDHGKTTLLDSIRKTKVAQGEAGGITQHIGAYHVDVEHNGEMHQVVFLDTPGHEAFTAMRARGTRVTDIAVLVVAADDGVRPQTIEAISHAKAAKVPIVVAINKIDKEGANPDRVKQELSEYNLVPEEWGGDTIMVMVSAIKGENLDSLLEMILLVAEVEDLHANPDRLAKGTVIEAHLDRAKGAVAALLVQNGTLKIGDIIVAGSTVGKVRAMMDDLGRRVEEATPSFAVEVLGLNNVPSAGDEFQVYGDEKDARAVVSMMEDRHREERLQRQAMASRRISLSSMSARAQEGELKELNLIVKADVQGSVEAILNSLQQLPQNEIQLRVLLSAPGEVTQTDIDLAAASSAVILAFNTTLASGARQIADDLGVDVRDYSVIYKLLDDVQGAMEGLLEPELVEEPLGQVEVRALFPVGRGVVAGCYVLSGKVMRNCSVRVHRGNEVVHTGVLDSLKRMKEDAKEVAAGYECGIALDNFNGWEIGDTIETFKMVTKRRSLAS